MRNTRQWIVVGANGGLVLVGAVALSFFAGAASCGAGAASRSGSGGSHSEAGGVASAGGTVFGDGGAPGLTGAGGLQDLGGQRGSGGTAGAAGTSGAGGGGAGGGGAGAVAGGGTTGTSSSAGEDVPAGTVCARLSDVQCAAEAACCKSPGRSLDACKAAMAKKCAGLYLDQVSTNPISGYVPGAAGIAVAEFQRRAATCDPTVVTWGASASGLRGIFPGTESQGADCTPKSLLDSADAAAHLFACQSPADTACLPGLAWKCTPRASVGGACFSDTNCQSGLYCDNPQTTLIGATCKAAQAVGATCTAGSQCESLVCKGGACVPADVQNVYCLGD